MTAFSLSVIITLSVFAEDTPDPLTNGGLNATDNTNTPNSTVITPSDDNKSSDTSGDMTEEELLALLEEGIQNGEITEEEAAQLYEEAFPSKESENSENSENQDNSNDNSKEDSSTGDLTKEQLEGLTLIEESLANGEITEEQAQQLAAELLNSEESNSKTQTKTVNKGLSELKYDVSVLNTFPGATSQRGMTFLSYKSRKYLSKYVSCKGDSSNTIGNSLKNLKLRMGALKPICRKEVTYQYLPYRTYRKSRR